MKTQDLERKRKKEQEAVEQMIHLYCRGNHRQPAKGVLCSECQELLEYAKAQRPVSLYGKEDLLQQL